MKKWRVWILMAAVILIAIGVCQNDHWDVWNKAIRICYECIGIG